MRISKRRRWKLDRDGPGRFRLKIAEMLKEQLGIEVEAHRINCNNSPQDRLGDIARWDVDGWDQVHGIPVHVCSWDRMGDIIRSKKIEVVENNPTHFEVSHGALPVKKANRTLVEIFSDEAAPD